MKLFNFSKPGKGVSKNQAKKRGFFRFFEIYIRSFWRFCTVNLWHTVISLPLFTCGLADVGMAYVARNTAIETPTFGLSDFFDIIKKNWKTALITGIIRVLLIALLVYDWFYFSGMQNELWGLVLMAGIIFIFMMFTMMNFYIPILTVTFRPKLKKLYKNSLILAIAGIRRNLPMALFILAFYGAALWLLWIFFNPFMMTIYIFFFTFVFPGFRALMVNYNAFIIMKDIMIDPYYEAHPDEDIEIRRSLGLYEEPEDEAVFEDTI